MENKVIIVIIAHKKEITQMEKASLNQCYKILGNYPIKLICPEGLDISEYKKINSNIDIDFIDSKWQSNYSMFNRLKIEPFLYKKFENFNYILFYELDAWVFRDELEYWCDKDIDYIGAPWFEGFHNAKPGALFLGIGNGGFSLRKIKSLLKVLNSFSYIIHPASLIHKFILNMSYAEWKELVKKLTVKNNTFHSFNDFESNEDYFWFTASKKFKWFKTPSLNEALKFSIEVNPSYFITDISRLPFGCHGWNKYEPEFWKKYIQY